MNKTTLMAFLVQAMVVVFIVPAPAIAVEPSPPAQITIYSPVLYQKNCAKCHGNDGRAKTWRGFVTFARDLTNPRWQELVKDEHFIDAIKKGPGLMPGFEDTFSQSEIEALAELVRSLKAPAENSDQP